MKKKILFYLTEQQIDRLNKEASLSELSKSDLVRRIIDFYFEKQGEKKHGK